MYSYRYLDAKDRDYEDTLEYVFMDIALYNIEGLTKEDAKDFFKGSNCNPAIGSVAGLIYFTETEPIAKEYYDEIIKIFYEAYGDCIPYESINSLNNLTWFAWVYMVCDNEGLRDKVISVAALFDNK